MTYKIQSGIQLSLDNGSTWLPLTDHNREPVNISLELIETQSRMASGAMRKYVIAKKHNISVSWKYVPSRTSECVDGNFGAAWLESFYQANAGIPIRLRIVSSELSADTTTGSAPSETVNTFRTGLQPVGQTPTRADATGSQEYSVFMTSFSKTIINRTKLSDYVDMSIDFTEI